MKRRTLLHVINFLLPILFFLSLDIASFFIADHRGEKLGFKVTVLLAISVLLLILNDILPSMSNKTPLIATYCIVIVAMMLLSLLETILVTYLMEKDSASYEKLRLKNNLEEQQEKVNNCNTEEKREKCCPCICKVSDSEKQHELLPVAEVYITMKPSNMTLGLLAQVNNSIQWRESHVLLLILEELKELQHTLSLHLHCRHQPCCHQTSAHLSPPPRHSPPNCINESAAVSGDAPRCSHHSHEGNRFVAAMMLTGFIFLLFLTDGVLPENNCSYQDVLNHLQLTKTNELYSMTRPVKNYKRPTRVSLEVLLYAILDVVKKDKAPPSPYLTINDKGDVEVQNDQVLVSTCRMHIYKFPFDIQNCNLSFKSIIHTAKDIRLQPSDNSTEATEWSRDVMRTQYEWLFLNMTVTTNNASDLISQDIIIYTITMKRRSLLYIVNFLVPVLFFLCLDLASFLISDSGGEKLSFKVTVLLAVTVLQLILNEILPASSNRIPLIGKAA
ncbi:hypothetical protein F7725_014496 [Dissostichus mawsoni]|uniref:Uncharacterized protein n=1 Tax=Dissostichus mawsoni TaxID=36200 RepID=A0A7J5Z0F5_DISMA|nr:hypothetical protein F7725_014496 [Dissostichus mawsoni]